MAWYNNKNFLSFVGGVAATAAATQFVKSGKAKEVAVNTMAKGMQIKDDAQAAYATIKEDAQDIVEEAKNKNAGE